MNAENQERKLFKNTGILAVGTVLTKCVSFIVVIFYSAWLSGTEYGQFELFLSYVTLLIPLFSLSVGEAIFRLMLDKTDLGDKQQLVTSGLLVYFCGFLISSVAACTLLYSVFGDTIYYFVLLYAAEMIYNFCTFVVRGVRKLTCYAISGVINTVAMAVSTVLFVRILGLGLRGLIAGYTLGYLCASLSILAVVKISQYISFNCISKSKLKEMLTYSLPLIPNSIAWWIASASDRTIVAAVLGTDYTGIYAIAQKIPSICVILYNVFHLSWQENVSDAFIEGENHTEYFNYNFPNR